MHADSAFSNRLATPVDLSEQVIRDIQKHLLSRHAPAPRPTLVFPMNGGTLRHLRRYVRISEQLAVELDIRLVHGRLRAGYECWLWVDRRLLKRKARRASRH